ncbi:MAG: hypothetical protein HYY18_13120 [Planctomycetes bacterium]|nr:hypothetical protein [Planctomycetota bacterium]
MSASELLLLDTSVVLNVIRANDVARRMDASLNLRSRPDKPLTSVISIAEARAFARLRN